MNIAYLSELFGTMILVLVSVGAGLSTGNAGLVAFTFGATLMILAICLGNYSGCHVNPAVTICLACAKKFPWRQVAPYIGAQVAGGLIGSFSLWLIYSQGKSGNLFYAVSNGFGAHSPNKYALVSCFLAEAIFTAFFTAAILAATSSIANRVLAPIAIGAALGVAHIVLIPITNASLNPARSIATAVFAGGWATGQLWLFLIAPVVGAVIAGLGWVALFDSK